MSEANTETPEIESGSVDSVINQMEQRGDFELEQPEEVAAVEETAEEVEAAPDDAETAEVEEEAPADEQMIAYENEEGEQVEISLNDALDSHGKLETMTARNAELETQAQTMPENVKTVLSSLDNTLGQYQQELEDILKLTADDDENNTPEKQIAALAEADRSLVDIDPMGYQDQLRERDKKVIAIRNQASQKIELRQRIGAIQNERMQYNQQMQESYLQEQANEINKFWPDVLSNKDTRGEVLGLLGEYGFTEDESGAVTDHRQLKLLKDLLEFKAAKTKTSGDVKKAMKIVRNNPTLVKRGTKAPATSKNQNSMARLKKSGSIDDAVNLLMGN
jgi:hypothetical protein